MKKRAGWREGHAAAHFEFEENMSPAVRVPCMYRARTPKDFRDDLSRGRRF